MIGDKSPYHVSFAPYLRLLPAPARPDQSSGGVSAFAQNKTTRRILPQLRALDARAESGMLRVAGNCWD